MLYISIKTKPTSQLTAVKLSFVREREEELLLAHSLGFIQFFYCSVDTSSIHVIFQKSGTSLNFISTLGVLSLSS